MPVEDEFHRQERILAIGGEVVDVIAPFLEMAPYRIERVPSGRMAVLLASKMRYQHLLVGYPLPDIGLVEFFDALRRPESASPTARLLVVTDDSHLAQASAYRDEGFIAGAISIDLDVDELAEMLTSFMKTAPRVKAAMEVELSAIDGGGYPLLAETVNLSESGALVVTDEILPAGTKVLIRIKPPRAKRPIDAQAVVVRTTNAKLEGLAGLGLRFVGFEGDSFARLAVQIRSLLAEYVV